MNLDFSFSQCNPYDHGIVSLLHTFYRLYADSLNSAYQVFPPSYPILYAFILHVSIRCQVKPHSYEDDTMA